MTLHLAPGLVTLLVSLLAIVALGREDSLSKEVSLSGQAVTHSDLSLANFFSEGWDQSWSKRERGDGTPNMSLLRVQPNFLARLIRLDTSLEIGRNSPAFSQSEFANTIMEYALNRRFMPAVFVNHQWLKGRTEPDNDGTAGGMFMRFQLYDLMKSSLALNLKVALPDRDIGEHLTIWSYALAGWEDLNQIGLKRTGIYYHVQHEMLAGPAAASAARNDLTYDISIAKTWSSPHATLQNFTTFLEAYGKTLLDGGHAGRTTTVLTPGFRFTLASRHIVILGFDLPVAGPRTNDEIFRFTWVTNF